MDSNCLQALVMPSDSQHQDIISSAGVTECGHYNDQWYYNGQPAISAACTSDGKSSIRYTLRPPFSYSYQCSSAVVINYVPIFIIMFAYIAVKELSVDALWRVYLWLDPVSEWTDVGPYPTMLGAARPVIPNPRQSQSLFGTLRRMSVAGNDGAGGSSRRTSFFGKSGGGGVDSSSVIDTPAGGKSDRGWYFAFMVDFMGLPVLTLTREERDVLLPHLLAHRDVEKERLVLSSRLERPAQDPGEPAHGPCDDVLAHLHHNQVLPEVDSYVADIINAFILLVTFGAVCPLLAITIIVAVVVLTARRQALLACFIFEQYQVGLRAAAKAKAGPRQMVEVTSKGAPAASPAAAAATPEPSEEQQQSQRLLALLESDCARVSSDVLAISKWLVVQLMAVYFSVFVLDIVGDRYKTLTSATTAATCVCVITFPLLMRLGIYLYKGWSRRWAEALGRWLAKAMDSGVDEEEDSAERGASMFGNSNPLHTRNVEMAAKKNSEGLALDTLRRLSLRAGGAAGTAAATTNSAAAAGEREGEHTYLERTI